MNGRGQRIDQAGSDGAELVRSQGQAPVGDGTPNGSTAPAAAASPEVGAGTPSARGRARRRWLAVVALALGFVVLSLAGTGYDYEPVPLRAAAEPSDAAAKPDLRPVSRSEAGLRRERRQLETALRLKVPRGTWIVIDQTHNRLRLMRGTQQVLAAPCSAGSGLVLKEGAGKRVWVFDTPRGQFRVISKLRNPVWRKPDWAFVEEGEPIPRNAAQRFEYGSLGEYALYFGDGYMIHGTLYERLLGRPVSHGCIRLGRAPLREVYRLAPLGTAVYIY